MNLQDIERKGKQINRSVYGLLAMAVIVFVLILVVIQLQYNEKLKRDKRTSDYHLNISKKSLELMTIIDKSRLQFRGYDLERDGKNGTINNDFSVSPISIGLSKRDQVDMLKYEINKHVKEISTVQARYADPKFTTITSLLNKAHLNVQADLNKQQLKESIHSLRIDGIVGPLVSVVHQIQRLHQHAYNQMRKSTDDFQRQKRNQLITLIAAFTIMGLFGLAKIIAIVRRTLSSLTNVQQTLYKQSMIIDQIHDSVISTNLNGVITSWNKGSEKLLQYKCSEILGKSIATIYPDEDRRFLQKEIIDALKKKGELEREVRLQRKSGEIFFAHLSLSILYDELGNANGMIGYSVDINDSKLAKITLQDSEQRYRSLIKATTSIIWTANELGEFVVPQDSWEKYTGQQWEEYKGLGWTKMIHPDDIERILIAWKKAAQELQLYDTWGRVWNDNFNEWRNFEVRAVPIMNSDDTLREWVGIITDITDRKNTEEEIERLASIVRHSPDFIGISDIEGHAQFVNDAGRKLVGIRDDEQLFGTMIADYFPEDERDIVVDEIIPSLLNKGRWVGENKFHNFTSGEDIPVWFDCFRIDNPVTGEPLNFATITRDLREQKQIEEALIASEKRFKKISQATPVGIFQTDANGECVFTNKMWQTITGYSEQQALGTGWTNALHPEDREAIFDEWNKAVKESRPFTLEYRFQRADGSTVWVFGQAHAEYNQQGDVVSYVGTITDISKIKAAEAEFENHSHQLEKLVDERTLDLATARDEAERANIAKSEFLSRMSHELRTPMNAILGFGQILEMKSEGLDEIQRSNVQEILVAGRHLLNLINDVLDMARIESGRMEVTMEAVHVDEVLQQSLALEQSLAKASQIEIIDNISNKGYVVQADFTRLKQVLVNLLSNAVKYNSEHGRITLDSQVIDKQRLRICVMDTGKGLTEEEITKLFTSFERLDAANNVEGTGIGLVITQHLTKLMGGNIGVESTPGKGSTFWVELALTSDV